MSKIRFCYATVFLTFGDDSKHHLHDQTAKPKLLHMTSHRRCACALLGDWVSNGFTLLYPFRSKLPALARSYIFRDCAQTLA